MGGYVHGYSEREAERLADQAAILHPLLHDGIAFPDGAHVLEPGCGTGKQTEALLKAHPGIRLTCLDIDGGQLARAGTRIHSDRVAFVEGDLMTAPLAFADFDYVFVCFFLEHLRQPKEALAVLRRMVRPGGGIVVIEGDHGSCRFHPETPDARAVWESLSVCQRRLGGDPDIGRKLYGLLAAAGFVDIAVEPRLVYADAGKPVLRNGFVRRIIVPMVEGADTDIDDGIRRRGLADLRAIAERDEGVFCYTFFRATARIPLGRMA